MGAKEKDKELDHTIYFNKTHANAWVFLFGSQLRSAGPKTNNSSFSLLLGKQTGDEAERQQRAAPRYRTIVKSEVRKTKLPSCPAGSGTNNSSLSHPAGKRHRTIIRFTSWDLVQSEQMVRTKSVAEASPSSSDTEQVRKSESESPTGEAQRPP